MVSPPSYPINEIRLDTPTEGKIINVNLYGVRADISRLYTLKVASGQNLVFISGLPNVLDQSSIRVEGRGQATIQDVTVSLDPVPSPPSTSPKLEELEVQRDELGQALSRCTKTLAGLDRYLDSLSIQHVSTTTNNNNAATTTTTGTGTALLSVLEDYNGAAEKYDKTASELRRALKQVQAQIADENLALATHSFRGDKHRPFCLVKVAVNVFAEAEGDVELVLKYAVKNASWGAVYDIRVKTDTKEEPVEIIYKAAIQQSTGEDWTDVPVMLETAISSFGLSLPVLNSWNLSVYKAVPPLPPQVPGAAPLLLSRLRGGATSPDGESSQEEYTTRRRRGLVPMPLMAASVASVTSQGGVNATFRIPGLVTVPSDGASHNMTVATLTPEAKLLWVSVPSVNPRVHLTTSIKNTSEYTFLSGLSSVYVDGSFIAKSSVPLVSPQESFTCAFGLDPSVRITYHPQVKKSSQFGMLTRTSVISYSQRISIYNSKLTTVDHLKITDRIPVSQDAQISVKLLSPALVLPGPGITSGSSIKDLSANASTPGVARVAEGVVAQWSGGEDENADAQYLGKDGKIQWVCSLPSQKKIDLSLQWEVSIPSQIENAVIGL